jgi:hypothetical protein
VAPADAVQIYHAPVLPEAKKKLLMKQWMLRNKLSVIGAAVGALGGYLYWKFIGCTTGTCPITSNPRNSMVYFSAMGILLFNIFKTSEQKNS